MTSKPKLYLHIGRHKCGTSSLQRFLTLNAAVLDNLGYHYPEHLRQPFAHHPVAHWYAREEGAVEPETAREIDVFWQNVARHPVSIVSSEAFQNIAPARLAATLAPFDVTIIAYFREPLDYLLSSYAQKVKAGNTSASLEAYAESFYVPYHDFLTAWVSSLPAADLRVRVFSKGALEGADVRRDFLAQIDIPESAVTGFAFAQEDGNPSIGGDLLEFMRLLAPYKLELGETWWKLYEAVQRVAIDNPIYKDKPTMPQVLQDRVRARHQEQMSLFERDFLKDGSALPVRALPAGDFHAGLSAESFGDVCAKVRAAASGMILPLETVIDRVRGKINSG